MQYKAWFQCINEQCKSKYPLNKIIYRCETCGSLLEVQHDMNALARRDAKAWMKLFEDRYKSNQWPYGSGSGARRNGSCPQINDDNIVSLYEGGTNLFWAERFGKIIGVERPLDQTLRQHPQRLVQGPRHDGAGLAGQADDLRRRADQGGGLRLDGRHLGGAGDLLRGSGHPVHRAAAARARSPSRNWCSRSPTARWCCTWTPTSTAA